MSFSNDLEIRTSDNTNVISLFGQLNNVTVQSDPLADLNEESLIEDAPSVGAKNTPRKLVGGHQFPDQSIYTLQEQLQNLKLGLRRLKFYLDDLDDLIPR